MLLPPWLLDRGLPFLYGESWFCWWLFRLGELLKPHLLIPSSLGDNTVVKADVGGAVPQLPHLKGVFILAGDV